MMRDTALYYPLRNLVGVRIEGLWPSLKKLAAAVLNEDMHAAGIAHDPVRLVFFFLVVCCVRRRDKCSCLVERAADIKNCIRWRTLG